MITFTKVKLPYGWLSNMSPHSVTAMEPSGVRVWRTAEALFQASRFPADHPVREQIYDCHSPMGAKMLAKPVIGEMIIKPRSPEDLDLMRTVVGLKLEQHQLLLALLLGTGDEELVEDVTARPSPSGVFWGKERLLAVSIDKPVVWSGENWLGKIWMEHRTCLQAKNREDTKQKNREEANRG